MALFGGRPKRTIATAEEMLKQRQMELSDQRMNELTAFKQQAPQIQQQEVSDTRRSFAKQLQGNVQNLNRNSNASGLLYSGRRASNEAGLRGESAQSFAQEKDAIGKRLRDQIEATESDITNQRYGMMTNNLADVMRGNVEGEARAAQREKQLTGLMQMGGSAIGGMGGGGQSAGKTPVVNVSQQTPTQAGGYNTGNYRPYMYSSSGP